MALQVSAGTNIFDAVAIREAAYSGFSRDGIQNCYLAADLHLDGWELIDLCEELERTYDLDLRPLFAGRKVSWFIWKREVARDITVGELAAHIVDQVARMA